MRVELTWSEAWQAVNVGVMRQMQNVRQGRKHRYGASGGDAWQMHIDGAIGEAVVAKLMNRWWSGALGDHKAADVGGLQVRTTSYQDGRLIVHPGERDDDVFILVVGSLPVFDVAGWMLGGDAKSEKYWKDPQGGRPAYFVPQRELMAMEDLALARVKM